jgi:predicted alpha/beta-fold hydrolase
VSKWTSVHTYHAGKTDDLRAVLRVLATRPEALDQRSRPTLAIMGFSLGGAMTIKLLGEPLVGLPLVAGVAVSAPLDLVIGSEHLRTSTFGLYERAVVRGLMGDVLEPTPNGTPRLTTDELAALERVRSLSDFDDAITAPRHGWRNAQEYYAVNSAARYLPQITVPTLVIHALDDPMIPAAPYLAVDWESLAAAGHVSRAITEHGGHVGFHERGNPMPWYVGRAVEFLLANVPAEHRSR